MKIVFMGTSDFAVPCLKAADDRHEVAAVFTQPDRPKGRGMKLQPTPVKAEALLRGLPVHQPDKVRDPEVLARIAELKPDCIVVVSYGQILPKHLLDIPALGCINVHASLLPDYRGAAPIHWAILNGETQTGVTTMFMDVGLDTGDMILKATTAITADMNVGELHDCLAVQGGELLLETLDRLAAGTAPRQPQDLEAGCYAPMIGRELSEIDWGWDNIKICNRIRGLDPWPAAHTMLQDTRLKLYRPSARTYNGGMAPGTVLAADQEGLLVAAGTGAVLIRELQGDGSRRMPAAAYVLGRPIPKGTRLGG